MKATEVKTISGREALIVIELLNHGEAPERIAEVEGIPLDMVLAIARIMPDRDDSTIVH